MVDMEEFGITSWVRQKLAQPLEEQAPALNEALLDKTLEEVRVREAEGPDEQGLSWNQGDWVRETECGTAMCFAGWAVFLQGHQIRGDGSVVNPTTEGLGVTTHIMTAARDELGLTDMESHVLFSGSNRLHHVEMAVQMIKERRGLA